MDQEIDARLGSLRGVLFDLDGTLLDTLELIYRCYVQTIQECFQHSGDRTTWEQHVGLPLREVFLATLAQRGQPADEEVLTDTIRCYRRILLENEPAVSTFPGIRDLLETLKLRGMRLAIVTSKHSQSACRHLQSQHLGHYFDVIVAGDHCANNKPHPEPFVKALAELGLDPKHAAMVGDSEHDIFGSRAAGVLSVAACWGTLNRSALLAAKPDLVAESPKDILRHTQVG